MQGTDFRFTVDLPKVKKRATENIVDNVRKMKLFNSQYVVGGSLSKPEDYMDERDFDQ